MWHDLLWYYLPSSLGAFVLGWGCSWFWWRKRMRAVVGREVSASISKMAEEARAKGPSWVNNTFWAPLGLKAGPVRADKNGHLYNA